MDNRKPPGAEKKHQDTESVWSSLMAEYSDRIIFYADDVTSICFPEKLDGIFDDSDHRTETIVAHARRHWGSLKKGAFYAVHDIDYKGSYYDEHSVRSALDILWKDEYLTGPDHMAWAIKSGNC